MISLWSYKSMFLKLFPLIHSVFSWLQNGFWHANHHNHERDRNKSKCLTDESAFFRNFLVNSTESVNSLLAP